jgi:hypothetical protein
MQALRALLAQLLGLAAAWGLARVVPGGLGWPVLVGAAALGAAAFSRWLLGQARWWVPIHLLFLPALVLVSRLDVGSGVWLAGLVALAVVFWGTFKGDVPLFLSSEAVTEAVVELVAARAPGRIAELGAGLGTVAVPLARRFPERAIDAWERAPGPFLTCWLRARGRGNLRVLRRDFWAVDLGGYDVVFVFLSPAVMERLTKKVRAEMRPGTLFVSAAFECPGWAADEEHVLDDRRGTHLYVHRIGGHVTRDP